MTVEPGLSLLCLAMFAATLAMAQDTQYPPAPTLAEQSPFVLDGSRGPLSIECVIEYPTGDTDFIVEMSVEKIIWDNNNKENISKTICTDAKSSIADVECAVEHTSVDAMAVKNIKVTFPSSDSANSYFPGTYVCKRKARKRGVRVQTQSVEFQIMDCMTNSVPSLTADGQEQTDENEPISVQLTQEAQVKEVEVACLGRTLNPGESSAVKVTYQKADSTEPKEPGYSIIESLSVVPQDINYAILASERNITVNSMLKFGINDVGYWFVDCSVEQQQSCESQKAAKRIKLSVEIPNPIINCPSRVSPEVIPGASPKPAEKGKPAQLPLRAAITCNVTDGKVHTPETQPVIKWYWQDGETITDESSDDTISEKVETRESPFFGWMATLNIGDVLENHYRTYRIKVVEAPGGDESPVLAESEVQLTAGNIFASQNSAAMRLGTCLLLVLGAITFLQFTPSTL